ncbi:hypothetical protein [Flavobacterium hungaricum]|uniref:Uncharacterized protein n=1 Tax=Flavobacterium hungaricum TaxID=2082725 RepID=A0ABR9TL68_9FLAO|nr:hypothetical protein [Flavobacterium hungaricum]MBE8726116.1 hypothetical protein [Flavobacterium hungaricum]
MRLLTFFLLFSCLSNAQGLGYEAEKRELLSDIIRPEAFKLETFIATKIDSANVEHLLKLILEKPYITNFSNQERDFIITGEELEYFAKNLRKQYQLEWKEDDFNNRKVIQQSDIPECLDQDINRQVMMVSHPIYKSDQTIFVYLANLCCCGAYGNSGLFLYTKKDGIWKKSFKIIEEDY